MFFGLAAIIKYTFVVIIPLWLTQGIAKVFSAAPQSVSFSTNRVTSSRCDKAILLAAVFGAAGVVAYLLIRAAYGFRFSAIADGQHPLPIDTVLSGQTAVLRWIAELAARDRLAPESWIYGQLFVLKYLRRPAFLMGEFANGFWT